MNDLVSIIIPYYKKKIFFKKTINSVQQQTYKNLEIILIYDDSDKSDLLFIKRVLKKFVNKKIIINKKNLGVGRARNAGILKSRGKFIAFLDADDIWHKDKIKQQIHFMKKNNVSFSFTNYSIVNKNLKVIKEIKVPTKVSYRSLLFACNIGLSSVVLKSNLLKNNKFSALKTKEDYLLWLELSKKNIKMIGINRSLVSWRKTNNSLSSSTIQKIKDAYTIYSKHLMFSFIKSVYYVLILSLNFLKKRYL